MLRDRSSNTQKYLTSKLRVFKYPLCSFITSCNIYHGYSEGGGYFSTPIARLSSSAAFVVVKHRDLRTVSVLIQSPELKWFIEEATGKSSMGTLVETLALEPSCGILQYYWRFKLLFWQLEHNVECARFMPLIRLFIQGFLVEKCIWESFNLRQLCQDGRLEASHWQEMEGISIGRDIDDCERLFRPIDMGQSLKRTFTYDSDMDVLRSVSYEPGEINPISTKRGIILHYLSIEQCIILRHIPYRSHFKYLIEGYNGIKRYNDIQHYFKANLESMKTASAVGHLSALSAFLFPPHTLDLTELLCERLYLSSRGHVCPIKVLDDLYSIAAKNGRVEVIEWLTKMFCDRTPVFVADIAADFGQQNVLDYLAANRVYGTRGCQPRREVQQRLKTRARWEQRAAIQESLRKAFHAEHEAFLDKSTAWNASNSLSNFAGSLSEPEKVWRRGFQTIRNLLDNQIPSDLQDIFGCVQVSRSMRSSLVENVDNYDGADRSQMYPDLVRWRCAVAESDHDLFDEIAASVWGQNLSPSILQDNWRLCDEALLEHFRGYFENLIAATRAACVYSDHEIHSGGTRRLYDIQDDFVSVPDESDSGSPETTSTAQNPDILTQDFIAQPQQQDHEIVAQPMIILLTATTIFMIIVAFFIGMLHDMDSRPYSCITNKSFSSSASVNRPDIHPFDATTSKQGQPQRLLLPPLDFSRVFYWRYSLLLILPCPRDNFEQR